MMPGMQLSVSSTHIAAQAFANAPARPLAAADVADFGLAKSEPAKQTSPMGGKPLAPPARPGTLVDITV